MPQVIRQIALAPGRSIEHRVKAPRTEDGQIVQPQAVRRLYYDLTTGYITRNQITYPAPGEVTDDNMIVVDVGADISPDTHKVDLTTKQPVPLTADDITAMEAPSAQDIKEAVISELQASNETQLPDAPGSTTLKAAWKAYRVTLRGLANSTSVGAAITAWPMRPDGTDAIPDWRKYGV